MSNKIHRFFIILLMPLLGGCLTGKGSDLQVMQAEVLNGIAVPEDQSSTNFNIFIQTGYNNCSGSIISPTFILTAAHCLSYQEDIAKIKLAHGAKIINFPEVIPNVPQPKNIYIHPKLKYDIALIELSAPVSDKYQPISLLEGIPTGPFPVEVFGYSRLVTSSSSDLLNFSSTPEYYDDADRSSASLNTKVLAAELLDPIFGKKIIKIFQQNGGVCSGDSGGPIIVTIDGQKIQIAVTVRVTPGVRQKVNCSLRAEGEPVQEHISWIKAKMAKAGAPLVNTIKLQNKNIFSELKDNASMCATLQARIYEELARVDLRNCLPKTIQSMNLALVESEKYCVSPGNDYSGSLKNTITKLQSYCDI